jgi:hypothetical protein
MVYIYDIWSERSTRERALGEGKGKGGAEGPHTALLVSLLTLGP